MRKFLLAAILSATILLPAAARADFVLDASLGQGYQVAPTPRGWEQLNLQISPGYAPSLPVLSWFRLQLGIVTDFATKSGTSTNFELRPTLTFMPPVLPIYARAILGISNMLGRSGLKREVAYGGAIGATVGLPSILILPGFGLFAEIGLLPRSRSFLDAGSKLAWVLEGRAGAYVKF